MPLVIKGTGSALPAKVVTNDEFSKIVDTSDEWIRERTGIEKRHIATGETVVTITNEASVQHMVWSLFSLFPAAIALLIVLLLSLYPIKK